MSDHLRRLAAIIGEPAYAVTCPGREDRHEKILPELIRRQMAWQIAQARLDNQAEWGGTVRVARIRLARKRRAL